MSTSAWIQMKVRQPFTRPLWALQQDRVALPHPTSASRNLNERCGRGFLSCYRLVLRRKMSRAGFEPATP